MRVEFYGVSRQRAGVDTLEISAATLGQLVTGLSSRVPALSDLIVGDRLHPALAASLNGDRFVRDPHTPLSEDDCVLLLSADAGG
jgi:molybdopterin converting factor small subunit